MTCFSELTGMRYCDGDLTPDERERVNAHLSECARCRATVAALTQEDDTLRALIVSRPRAEVSLRSAVSGMVLTLAAAMTLRWIFVGYSEWSFAASVSSGVVVLLRLIGYAGYPTAVAAALVFLLIVLTATMRRRPGVAIVTAVLLIYGSPLSALTRLIGERTAIVAASEVIQDNVLATGQVVRVEGTIRGDLYAMASRVDITGTVTGHVFAIAESVHVSGRVRSLTTFARTQVLEGRVNSWRAWGDEIQIVARAESSGGVVALGRMVNVNGLVQGRTRVYGNTMVVGPSARVAGLTARLSDAAGLHVAPGAAITGPQDVRAGARSRWSGEALALDAATAAVTFVVGLGLWHRRPRFLDISARRVAAWWPSLYRGTARVLLCVATAVALTVTVVGIPLAAVALILLAAVLVVGKAVVATFVAEHLVRPEREVAFALRLLAALLILTVLSLPAWGIGATLSALVSIAGVGAIPRRVVALRARRSGISASLIS